MKGQSVTTTSLRCTPDDPLLESSSSVLTPPSPPPFTDASGMKLKEVLCVGREFVFAVT